MHMGELIEHVSLALEDFISSTARVRPRSGRVLLTTSNPYHLFLRWRGGSVLSGVYISVHCPAALSELLNHRGFGVVRVEGTAAVERLGRASLGLWPVRISSLALHQCTRQMPPL